MYHMQTMHIRGLDLSHIELLVAVADSRSISAAATQVGLSQSAASHALANLRKRIGDPLFVRTREGFTPTLHGQRAAAAARRALDALRSGLEPARRIEPKSLKGVITLYLSDIGQMVLLPDLLRLLDEEAPGLRLQVRPIPVDRPGAPLASGEIDLAVGFFSNLTSGFHQRRLLRERYVCAVRRDHPEFKSGMTAKAFATTPHAFADASGMAHSMVERILVRHGIRRTIRLSVPQFMVLPLIIAESDLLVVLPSRLAETFGSWLPLKIMAPPVSLPPYEVNVYWHERAHRDPLNRWLRQAFIRLFTS
jgi:DNA-binding transcriptional LysR family regulator